MPMAKTARAIEEITAWIDGEGADDPEESTGGDRPTEAEIRRQLTTRATEAKVARRLKNVARAKELRAQSLSHAQIAVRMTEERKAPQRPPITERTVRRWLEAPKT